MWSLRHALTRALLGCALALPVAFGAAALVPSDASASVSIAVGFDALVKDADAVAVVTAAEGQSIWEDGRIYTYTKVKVDQGVAGDLGAGADGWVRTMGGVVGKIGQMVDGEPVLTSGKSSLLFLRKFKADAVFEVSARAQGQYPVSIDPTTKLKKVTRSNNAGILLPPKTPAPAVEAIQSAVQTQSNGPVDLSKVPLRLASDVIHDRPLEEASREIATAWRRLHPPVAK
jgi:hypothetical protein